MNSACVSRIRLGGLLTHRSTSFKRRSVLPHLQWKPFFPLATSVKVLMQKCPEASCLWPGRAILAEANANFASRVVQSSLPFNPVKPTAKTSGLKQVWYLIRPNWLLFVGVTATAIITALINIYTPRFIGRLVNVISAYMAPTQTAATATSAFQWSSLLHAIKLPALQLFGLFAGQGFLTFVYISLVSVLGEHVAERLRAGLYESLLKQDMAFYDQRQTGELIDRLTTDVAEFKHAFKSCISQGLKSATQIVGSVFQLMSISHQLTLTLLCSVPVFYGLGNLYGSYLRRLSKDAKSKDGQAAALAGESLSNIRTVRAFANEDLELEKYKAAVHAASNASQKLGFHIGIFQGMTNFSIGGMVLFVLFFGGNLVANQQLSGGDLMSYLLSIQSTQKSLSQLGVLFAQVFKATSAYARLSEYLHLEPSIPLKGGERLQLQGDIFFDRVSFAYPSRPEHSILDDFVLDIRSGEVVAFCGHSGAGKSTLAALIERFYDPTKGHVRLDGVSLRDLDASNVRKQIGYISQEPVLFSGSIADNIRYGRPNASIEEVEQAARLANAAEFIDRFPDRYNTLCGERGVSLSGGQRQRIAIARALLKDPKILIFDEATSALDAQSERVVQEALDRLMKGRTVIIIAHRLSTIENADKIVVLAKGGKIVEIGRHQDLIQRHGSYYRLYSRMHEED